MSKQEKKKLMLRIIMKRAWGLFKNGIISLSISLRLSWAIAKGKITQKSISKIVKSR